ncbi:N-formimino-L-glutamate deiminase [compost metagenome]
MQRRQLLGVQLHWQAQCLGGNEHPLDLRRGERQVLAKRIHGVDQPFGSQGREHVGADVIDIVVSAILVLRRQGVSRQAGAAHADRQFGAEATGHTQHLALVGQVQAVAGLDFDAGNAITHQAFQALGGTGEQFIFAGCAGGAYGAGDTATAGGDFRVADALQALFEFTAAVTAEHRVSVAVDQARCDPGPVQIIDGRVLARRQLTARADPLNVRS